MTFRNNNPGNIRNNPNFKWVGQIGIDYRGFVIFDTLENGTRALMRLLNTYVNTSRDTIGEIIYSYCPPTECNTELYIQQVSGWMGTGWHRNSKISPSDKTNFLRFVNCIVKKEFSQQLTAATLANGYNLAFNGITPAPPAQQPGINYAGLFVPALLLTGIVLISKRQ
jgi:hypothetical protein